MIYVLPIANVEFSNFIVLKLSGAFDMVDLHGTLSSLVQKLQTELCPPKFLGWSSIPDATVFGCWDFKEVIKVKWDLEDEGPHPIRLISFIIRKRDTRNMCAQRKAIWSHSKETAICKPKTGLRRNQSCRYLILDQVFVESSSLNHVQEYGFTLRPKWDFLLSNPNLELSEQALCPISFIDEEHWPALHTLSHLGQKRLVRRPGILIRLNKDRNLLERNLLDLERGSERAGKKDSMLSEPQWGKSTETCKAWLWCHINGIN